MPHSLRDLLSKTGAGLMVAATGIGAGDMIAAAVGGSRYGVIILWAALVGGLLKFVLNEGLAKWHLATGTTLIEGWVKRLPKVFSIYFVIYLVFWAFLVAATLISFCGLVSNTVFPLPFSEKIAVAVWGAIHSIGAVILIYLGGYRWVERIMQIFIALMFVVVIVCAVMVCSDWGMVISSILIPRVPAEPHSIAFILALIGGVGGTVTILCYSYWLQEKYHPQEAGLLGIRFDLGIAYVMTVLFGMAVIIIGASVNPEALKGYKMIVGLSDKLGEALGDFGKWSFLLGFWGAVFSSMLGVWSGVPYLYADFTKQYTSKKGEKEILISVHSKSYRGFLWYLAIPPILLVIFEKPVWIGIAYSVMGAFFMPFLAGLLLYMNNRSDWVGRYKNSWIFNLLLLMGMALFVVLLVKELL